MKVRKKYFWIILVLLIIVGLFILTTSKLSERKKVNEYNIYAANGTLPTLILSMELVKNNETPGFLWYAREGTMDKELISKYAPNIVLSKNIGNYESLFTDLANEMKQYVKEVIEKDPNAHFNFIVDEYRNWLEFPVFIEQGLTSEQYSVKYYSDGTLSYVAEYDILKEDSYELFVKEKKNYFETIEFARSGKYKGNTECTYLINEELGETDGLMDYKYDANYVLLATLRDNVEYYLQYPELIEFKDKKIKDEMKDANIKKFNIKDIFNSLTKEEKEMFFKIIKLDKELFDKEYFNSEENKYLIITGANPFYGKYNEKKFYELINEVVVKYGNEYKILYKPHPSALPDESMTAIFNSKDIAILPGRMPIEAITFVYDNLKLGGFPSSLYMNASANDTLFFFDDSKETLVSPLNKLYDEIFINAVIMN